MASNIERFNQYAGHFLAKLYQSFPEPCDLDTHEAVYGTPLVSPASTDDLQEATTDPEIRFCSHALQWLLETGYFKGEARLHNVQVARAVLTPKGLEALNAIPASLEYRGTLGEKLVGLASEGSKEAAKSAISEVIGMVVGAAARGFLTS